MDASINVVLNETILRDFGFFDLPENWEIIEINDLLSPDRGISVGVMYPGNHDPSGIPLIKVTDMKNNRINRSPDFRISRKKHEEYIRTEFQGGELLITLVGEVGKCAIVPQEMKGFNAARAIGVLRFKDQENISFIRWCLLCKPIQELMVAWSNTTVQTTLNLKEIKRLPIPWPPKKERGIIARILGSLDDKIELNRQMNETLEAMARAIFKSWFVDFDPVRAKAEGRQPSGMDAATAALFPSEMVEDDGREVPKGWRMLTLGDLCSLDKGVSYKGAFLSDEGTSMINLGCFTGEGNFSIDNLKFYTGEYRDRHVVKSGDIVIANTDITQKRVVLGSPAIVPPFDRFAHCIFTHHVYAVRFKKEFENLNYFVYFTLLNPEFRERAIGFATGTTVLALPRDTVLEHSFILPDERTIQSFNGVIKPVFSMIYNNIQQSRTLAQIRDALLPKLMSGGIQLSS